MKDRSLSGIGFAIYVLTASAGWLIHGINGMMMVLMVVSFVRVFVIGNRLDY